MDQPVSYIRIKHVLERTSLSRATIYRMMDARTFPMARKLGAATVWDEAEVNQYLKQLPRIK